MRPNISKINETNITAAMSSARSNTRPLLLHHREKHARGLQELGECKAFNRKLHRGPGERSTCAILIHRRAELYVIIARAPARSPADPLPTR